MGKRITAREARCLVNSVDMKELLLDDIYTRVKVLAGRGQRETHIYADKFEMSDIKEAINELEEDGYTVKLRKSGWLFKRVTAFTNILVKW